MSVDQGALRVSGADHLHETRGAFFQCGRIAVHSWRRAGVFEPGADDDAHDLCWNMADAALAQALADPRALKLLDVRALPLGAHDGLYLHAAREMRRILARAEDGDLAARGLIVAAHNERGTMATFKELVAASESIAPSHEAVRANDMLVTPGLAHLRFTLGRALDAIGRAEGCGAAGALANG